MSLQSKDKSVAKEQFREPSLRNGSPGADPVQTTYVDSKLNKAEAARFLEISLSEFKRREKAGLYVGTEIAGRRVYDRAYLERRKPEVRNISRAVLTQATEKKASAAPSPKVKPATSGTEHDPETIALIFRELAKDEDLIRIVVNFKLSHVLVRSIHDEWIELRKRSGGFHVSAEAARAIDALELDGFPVSSGEELAAALGAFASTAELCEACGERPRRPPTLCATCERPSTPKRSV